MKISTFRFGEIKARVKSIGAATDMPSLNIYIVSFEAPNGDWIEIPVARKRAPKTAGRDFQIAADRLLSLSRTARVPEEYRDEMLAQGEVSEEEIESTIEMAQKFWPYMEDALTDVQEKLPLYLEPEEESLGRRW